jgi:hypothetical protein
VRPGGCPNPLQVRSQGVLPVAILGTAGLDVTHLDQASLRLEGVPPLRSSIEDVGTPIPGEQPTLRCAVCEATGPDGIPDLTLKFDTQAIVEALGSTEDHACRTLVLTGQLVDGTPILGVDVVVLLGPREAARPSHFRSHLH